MKKNVVVIMGVVVWLVASGTLSYAEDFFYVGEVVCHKLGGPKGIVTNNCVCLFGTPVESPDKCACRTGNVEVNFYGMDDGVPDNGIKIAIGGSGVFAGGKAIVESRIPFKSYYIPEVALLHEKDCIGRPDSL